MNDPYKVLGVSPTATDDEIKSAYKKLVRKYHPDKFQDEVTSELAQEKMADVNAAYDQIMAERRSGNYGNYGNSGGYGGYSEYGGINYNEVRRYVQQGDITRADSMLDGVPTGQRTAEWYFLKGSVCYTRGWLNDAYVNFQRACQMQPNNYEYRAAFNQMNNQRGGFMAGNPNNGYNRNPNDTMDCCTSLCCADCCCEMMGGDLIPCC